jgi:hypothetical protein
MPLHIIDHANQTIIHECHACGDIHTYPWAALYVDDTVTTPICPACGRAQESFRVRVPDWEVGIGSHPGSMLGYVFPDTGGVVIEHVVGYDLRPMEVARRMLHRQLHAALIAAGLMSQGQAHIP